MIRGLGEIGSEEEEGDVSGEEGEIGEEVVVEVEVEVVSVVEGIGGVEVGRREVSSSEGDARSTEGELGVTRSALTISLKSRERISFDDPGDADRLLAFLLSSSRVLNVVVYSWG